MGLPISLDPFTPIALGVLTSTPGDEGGVSLLDSRGISNLLSSFVSGFFVCKASLFYGGLSISYGTFSGLRFFCASCSKPGGTFSCSGG